VLTSIACVAIFPEVPPLQVFAAVKDGRGCMMSLGILFTCTVVVELFVLWRLRFDSFVVAIVLAGTCLQVDYLTYTSVGERNYDGASHIAYIQSIASTWQVPDVFSCAVCGHPPLYYALGALWSKTVLLGGWMPLELGLQWLSLLLFFAFVVFSLLIVRSCTGRATTLRLAAALVVFWPSSIINSVRVHNDALASPLMLAALYFTAEWDKNGRTQDFSAALVISALALSTKASGYAVATALLLFTALRLRSTEQRSRSLKQFSIAALVLGTTGLLITALRTARAPRTPCQLILGSACNGRYVPPIPDSPSRFLSFHLHDFVSRLHTVPEDPILNRLAKSSLFGVMRLGDPFTDARNELLAHWISWGLLAMVTVCLVGLPLLGRAWLSKHRAYLGSVAIMVLFLLAFRIRAPNEFHEDFRHIFAALVPFCLSYAVIVARLSQYSKLLHSAGLALALLMIALSVAFFARIPHPASLLPGRSGGFFRSGPGRNRSVAADRHTPREARCAPNRERSEAEASCDSGGMAGITLDTGALIGFERAARRTMAQLKLAEQFGCESRFRSPAASGLARSFG